MLPKRSVWKVTLRELSIPTPVRILIGLLILGVAIPIVALVPPLLDNPFEVARQAVVDAGSWDPTGVYFSRGTYRFHYYLACSVNARILITGEGESSYADVELLHLPLMGWSLKSLRLNGAD